MTHKHVVDVDGRCEGCGVYMDELPYGPPIAFTPGFMLLADGSLVEKPCPFPRSYGMVQLVTGEWFCVAELRSMCWDTWVPISIVAFRLPADHHAYERRSNRHIHRRRTPPRNIITERGRVIGFWNIYRKPSDNLTMEASNG